jgi:hypothetical protein
MDTLERVVDLTTFIVALRKILIVGQANHRAYFLENGLDMAKQLLPYPLGQQHPYLAPLRM